MARASRRATSTEPKFVTDTPESAARRDRRRRRDEVETRAQWIFDNDPDVGTMADARKKARADIEFQTQVEKGLRDPESGELTRRARKTARANAPKGPRSGRSRRPASATRSRRAVQKTVRTVVAPFGSATSAGWTFFQGGLSLVLLYILLRDAKTLSAFIDGVLGGFASLGDPYKPLFGTLAETSPPPPTTRVYRYDPRSHRPPRPGTLPHPQQR